MATSVAARDSRPSGTAEALRRRFDQVRSMTTGLAGDLSDADASAQSMPDASPAKWHLAHTTWFFETFVLSEHVGGYEFFDERFGYLYNSYYEAKGARIGRADRGLLTRPSLATILEYRRHVDDAIRSALPGLSPDVLELIELGCQHEQQHQELLLTDVLHLFSSSPLLPGLRESASDDAPGEARAMEWIEGRSGPVSIGHGGRGFSFDSEGPRHTEWLSPHALADRLVTNAEWQAFIAAGAYLDAGLWLSDGWAWVRQSGVEAPLHWKRDGDGDWSLQFGLDGLTRLEPHAPVRHVSYFEAEAFARWAGARLPTEAEWEAAAEALDPNVGNFLDAAAPMRPRPATRTAGLRQMFGDVWEWTASAFLPHPGFRPAVGAIGEYNGKFMSGQFVLKGGSCATPRGHVRSSYRNFFYPHQRWQFTGLRLAKDI